MNRPVSFIVLGFILLAVLGLGSKLVDNPSQALRSILLFVAVTGIIIYVVKRFTTTSEQKSYSKAVKQSKKQHPKRNVSKKKTNVVNYSTAQSKKIGKTTKKSDSHLTVIEGKKGKKNRA